MSNVMAGWYDDAAQIRPDSGEGLGSGVGTSIPAAGIVLGDTTDSAGNTHSLVLNVPAETQHALLRNNGVFAIVSGTSRLSVCGDVTAQGWRFFVDSTTTGARAPVVVIKTTTARSIRDLASAPNAYASAITLNDDPGGVSIRVTALMTEVLSKAEPSQPNSDLYAALAEMILDPEWTGVMVFNATATVPHEVAGQSSGALADSTVAVFNLGFSAPAMTPTTDWPRPFFATVDQSRTASDELPLRAEFLRARFSNSALVAFEHG